MRRWISAAVVTALALVVASPAAAQREETERFTRTVRLGDNGRVSLENVSGAMTQNPSQSKPAAKQQKKPAQQQQ